MACRASWSFLAPSGGRRLDRSLVLFALILNSGPFPPPALPGLFSLTGPSVTLFEPDAVPPSRGGCPARPRFQERFPCCHRTPLRTCHLHYPGQTPAVLFSLSSLRIAAFPVSQSGLGSHIPLFEACSAFPRGAACSLAETLPTRAFCTGGFDRFVSPSAAPAAARVPGREFPWLGLSH